MLLDLAAITLLNQPGGYVQSPHLPPLATEPHDAVAHPRIPHALLSPARSPAPRSLLSRSRAHRCRRPPLTVPSSGASPRRSKPTGSSASSFSSSPRKESGRGRLNRRRHPFLLRHREPQVAQPHVADSPSPPSPTTTSFSEIGRAHV